jgi:hypothetical protein
MVECVDGEPSPRRSAACTRIDVDRVRCGLAGSSVMDKVGSGPLLGLEVTTASLAFAREVGQRWIGAALTRGERHDIQRTSRRGAARVSSKKEKREDPGMIEQSGAVDDE